MNYTIQSIHAGGNFVIALLTTQPQWAYYTPWLGTDCWSGNEKNTGLQRGGAGRVNMFF